LHPQADPAHSDEETV